MNSIYPKIKAQLRLFAVPLLLILLIGVVSILPLIKDGFFQSDDGDWMIIRFTSFYAALRDGQLPVRFLERLNHSYGYPLPNFAYPGFMYIASMIKAVGFGFVDSIKILLGLSMLGSGIFTYLWLQKLFDKKSALFGSLVYIFVPYHLYTLYTRGSVGEVLALAVVPFAFWQIERKSIYGISLAIALLILSHNILAVLFFPIICIYILFRIPSLLKKIFVVFLGLGLSAFFWLPALFDLRYTVFKDTEISNWTAYFTSLNQIGIATVIVLSLGFYYFIRHKEYKNPLPAIFIFVSIAALFMSISASAFIWSIIPDSFIQFPFRFLSLVIVSTAYLTAFTLDKISSNLKIYIGGIILFLFLATSILTLSKIKYEDKGESFYTTNQSTTTIKDEYMPVWVKDKPLQMPQSLIEGERIKIITQKSNKIIFTLEKKSDEERKVRINKIYFPGWSVINDQNIKLSYNNSAGVMELGIPGESERVELAFTETPVRIFADLVSIFSLLILFWIFIKKKLLKI